MVTTRTGSALAKAREQVPYLDCHLSRFDAVCEHVFSQNSPRRACAAAIMPTMIVLALIPCSDKTFEDIVERLVALVGPQPADDDGKADTHERPAPYQSEEKDAQPSAKTSFDQKQR